MLFQIKNNERETGRNGRRMLGSERRQSTLRIRHDMLVGKIREEIIAIGYKLNIPTYLGQCLVNNRYFWPWFDRQREKHERNLCNATPSTYRFTVQAVREDSRCF